MMKSIFLNIFDMLILNMPMILNLLMMLLLTFMMKNYNLSPMKLMIILGIFILMISMYFNILFKSWMMFIFPLIMIGGLMIMFMYVISLINNKMYKLNLNHIILIWIKFFLIIALFSLMYYLKFNIFIYQDLNKSMSIKLNDYSEMKLSNLYNFNKNSLTFLIMYLYFSLMIIMNICFKMNNPLRQMYF
uniref:NADH dehydrogenase subunit 6 n=1 Tax=Ichneumonidae sp. MT-2014 TaxID=1560014 RepID=A0A0A0RVQ9_9HYME|nr:NADH dehydrogenase subunit 6 [Ichneumonidae sp. MT-2014]